MTLRELSGFFLVFCLLSLVVHLADMAIAFGTMAGALFAVDFALVHFSETPRVAKMRRQPLL